MNFAKIINPKKKLTSLDPKIKLIHEVIHLYDEKRVGFWYNLSYLFPQLLVVLTIPLFFFVHWYIMLPAVT